MSIGDLARWLVAESERRPPLPELFAGFCVRLNEQGLDLWRAVLGLETLHPEVSGSTLRWNAGTMTKTVRERVGIATSDAYLRSPTKIVDDTGRPFRWRAGADMAGMPQLEELAAEGVTDYLMLPLPFLDTTRTAVVSYATRAEGGFQPAQLELLEAAAVLLSPWAERAILRRIATDLLAAYLGPRSGRLAYDGQIERGDVHTLRAALWCCDLRGFTALSDRLPRPKLVWILNRWFEVIGAAIEAGGGEILKFMGDGLLAVFPLDGEGASSCDRALAAAEQAVAGSRELDELLARKGEPPLRFGLGLHVGEVEYGNIGTRQRLDFTVIGPAVNMASRLESLTKELGVPALASAEFALGTSRSLPSLGRHRLRGIAVPVEVFGILQPALQASG